MLRTWLTAWILFSAAALFAQSSDKMIDADGHKLRVRIAGEGPVTVILENGMMTPLESWEKLIPEVAKFARVVAYDRAGVGRSEKSVEAPVSRQVARDLHAMLANAGLKPPYILVGASLGGTHIRVFTKMFPDEVAGLVFLDPAFVFRLRQFDVDDESPAGTKRMRDTIKSDLRLKGFLRMELESVGVSEQQALAAWPLPAIPAIVITAVKTHGMFDTPEEEKKFYDSWTKIHKQELVDKQPRAEHIGSDKTSHMVALEAPGLAADAIRKIVSQSAKKACETVSMIHGRNC